MKQNKNNQDSCNSHEAVTEDGKKLCRRDMLKNILGVGACVAAGSQVKGGITRDAYANDGIEPNALPPQEGDILVHSEGDNVGKPVSVDELVTDKGYITAWPMDPESGLIRDGHRFNKVLAIKLKPEEMNRRTKAMAVEGVVVYSGVCTHEGCDISAWVEEKKNFFCYCHYSRFDPRKFGKVTYGPARNKLPLLPVEAEGKQLKVAGNFTRSPGGAKKL